MNNINPLGEYIHQTRRFTGKVDGFRKIEGKKRCCIQSLRTEGDPRMLRTHVWIELSNTAKQMHLKEGDVIEFTGRVETYLSMPDRFGLRQAKVQHGLTNCGGFKVVS